MNERPGRYDDPSDYAIPPALPDEKPLEAGSNPSAGAAQSGGQLQTPTQSASESPGPQTHEEARQFHEGVLVGLTIYARESGASTLKSENPLLRRLMDEQGWKTIETFEKLPKPDWRIGQNCKPKLRTHPLFSCAHNCVIIGTRASSIHKDGLLLIAVDDGRQLLEPADDWVTA